MILYCKIDGAAKLHLRRLIESDFPFKRQLPSYRLECDRLKHRLGEVLIHYGLATYFHMDSEDWHFKIGTYGKPYIVSKTPVYISLSYSEEVVACALSRSPIGLDIEKLAPIECSELKHQFTKDECRWVTSLKDFYTVWTRKEAYSKLTGEGLTHDIGIWSVLAPLEFEGQSVVFHAFEKHNVLFQIATVKQSKKVDLQLITIAQCLELYK